MILLGTGNSEDVILIVFLLSILLAILINRKLFFKILAKVNKLIIPSLYKKDIGKLKSYEKVILGYRYWVTKNSL
ncbi:MAG: hypothetical protein HOB54_01015 [Flavobacteriales bacterium]|jgi:hypothetical protein|nr:hypothetical protein [Flavobacteriales bacterium]